MGDERRFASLDVAQFNGGCRLSCGKTVCNPLTIGGPCCALDTVVVAFVKYAEFLCFQFNVQQFEAVIDDEELVFQVIAFGTD